MPVFAAVTEPSLARRLVLHRGVTPLVIPDLLLDGGAFDPLNPKLAAGGVVILVALRSRNPWLPFILGMAMLLLLRKGFGWLVLVMASLILGEEVHPALGGTVAALTVVAGAMNFACSHYAACPLRRITRHLTTTGAAA